jgi:hypothetical protein
LSGAQFSSRNDRLLLRYSGLPIYSTRKVYQGPSFSACLSRIAVHPQRHKGVAIRLFTDHRGESSCLSTAALQALSGMLHELRTRCVVSVQPREVCNSKNGIDVLRTRPKLLRPTLSEYLAALSDNRKIPTSTSAFFRCLNEGIPFEPAKTGTVLPSDRPALVFNSYGVARPCCTIARTKSSRLVLMNQIPRRYTSVIPYCSWTSGNGGVIVHEAPEVVTVEFEMTREYGAEANFVVVAFGWFASGRFRWNKRNGILPMTGSPAIKHTSSPINR